MIEHAAAFAPATIANLGVGLDVLGLAVAGIGDTVRARVVSDHTLSVRMLRITGQCDGLQDDLQHNTAVIAALETLRLAGVSATVELELDKGIPIGSGLGSSAASAAAAAYATNRAIGSPLRKRDLVAPCLEAEAAVSGRHIDNVAPALLGGMVLARRTDPIELVRIPPPPDLMVAVVLPTLQVMTRASRQMLPQHVSLETMVRQTADIAAFVSACHTGDLDLIARCINDGVAEPVRAASIPAAMDAIQAARESGALGASLSGSGPAVFGFCRSRESAEAAADAIAAKFAEAGAESQRIVCSVDCPGVRSL